MTDIVYGIRITGEASGAKKAFEETKRAQEGLTGAEKNNARAAQEVERATERKSMVLRRIGLAVTAATVAFVAYGRSAINAAIQAERAHNRLEAVLRATGGALGITREEFGRLAESLAAATQFDDDSFRNAQAELVKFGNIHGQIFKEALRLSADLAAFMGTDVPQGAQMIGRALQSPTEGLRLLEREFGKLTDAEEKHITTLVSQGRAVEAQNAVLELLQRKIGGTADLMNTGLTRATGDLSKAWDDLLKTVGREGTIFNRTLGGATALIRDIEGELKGVRTPLRALWEDTVAWVAMLRFVPGAIGMIGTAARDAQLEMDKTRRTVSGRIRQPGLEDAVALEAALAATPARAIALGGDTAAAREREAAAREREKERAAVAAELAASLQAQQDILDEGSDLSVKFLQQQDQKTEALREEAEAVRAAIDPWHAYRVELERLQKLRDQGFLTEVDFVEAVGQAANKAAGELQDMGRTTENVFSDMKGAVDDFGRELARSLARGEEGFRSLGDVASRFLEELLAIQLERRLIAPALNAGTSFLDNLFRPSTPDAFTGNAAPFHGGRGPGEFGTPRAVHPGLFRHAPRLHTGIGPGELPAIIRHDESVLTPGQMRALGGGSLKINVINESGVPVQGQASALRVDASGMAVDLVLRRLAVDGVARQSLSTMLTKPQH